MAPREHARARTHLRNELAIVVRPIVRHAVYPFFVAGAFSSAGTSMPKQMAPRKMRKTVRPAYVKRKPKFLRIHADV